jgi:hypothetical protein
MSRHEPTELPHVNRRIAERLGEYPEAVSELAMRAIELSETMSENDVFEQLQQLVGKIDRKHGGE